MQFGVAQPSGDTLVVIVAGDDDGLVALADDDGVPQIYGSRNPEVQGLVEAAKRAYEPTARAMPVTGFRALARGAA